MNCDSLQARLDDYLDGDLPERERTALEAHARECGACRARLARGRELREALRGLPVPEPDEAFFDRALARATAARGHDGHSGRHGRRHGLGFGAGIIGGALAASLVLVLGWNLLVGPNGQPAHRQIPGLTIALNDVREVSLVVDAARALDNATFTVLLPEGVELAGFPGQREVSWQGRLAQGQNLLVLPVRAAADGGGELVAYVKHTDKRKTFRLKMDVVPATQSQRALPDHRMQPV